jgi:hypothetical protein
VSEEAPPTRRRRQKAEKKSVWKMDLQSLGKKGEADDDVVEHPPFVPVLPQVNLLPKQIKDSIAVAKIRRRLVLAAVLIIVAAGGVWYLQGSQISAARDTVAAATSENQALRSDVEKLAPVKQMYEQITRLQDLVTTTMASQPEAAVVIERLTAAGTAAGGDAIDFANAAVTYTGIPQAGKTLNACPNPDPFGTEITIGCVTFSASAGTRGQVSDLLRELESDPLFVGPYVTSSTIADLGGRTDAVAFSGSAGISLEGLRTKLTQEQVDALLAPPEPEPVPSSSATPGGTP